MGREDNTNDDKMRGLLYLYLLYDFRLKYTFYTCGCTLSMFVAIYFSYCLSARPPDKPDLGLNSPATYVIVHLWSKLMDIREQVDHTKIYISIHLVIMLMFLCYFAFY